MIEWWCHWVVDTRLQSFMIHGSNTSSQLQVPNRLSKLFEKFVAKKSIAAFLPLSFSCHQLGRIGCRRVCAQKWKIGYSSHLWVGMREGEATIKEAPNEWIIMDSKYSCSTRWSHTRNYKLSLSLSGSLIQPHTLCLSMLSILTISHMGIYSHCHAHTQSAWKTHSRNP